MELYISKLANPTIQLNSRPRLLDGLNEEVSFDLVGLNSSVSRGFFMSLLKSVSMFLVLKVMNLLYFLGRTMSKFM